MSITTRTMIAQDGTSLHFDEHGTIVPTQASLIFLHYYGGSPSTFYSILCQPSLAGAHSILYHARGWKPSGGPTDPKGYSIRTMAGDLEEVISATGLDKENIHHTGFILIGHSMGAKVAQYYAATIRPPTLKGMLLLAPAPLRGLQFPDNVKAKQREAYGNPESVRYVLENVLTAGPGALDPEVIEQCIRDSLRGNEYAKAAWPDYSAEENCGVTERNVDAKVNVVVLRGDRDFERELVGELGLESGWRNVLVEDCGHLMPLERPEVVAKEIRELLDNISHFESGKTV